MTNPAKIIRGHFFFIFLCFLGLSSWAKGSPGALQAEVYDGGSLSIENEKKVVALVEPKAFDKDWNPIHFSWGANLPNWKNTIYFEGDSSSDPVNLKGILFLENGSEIDLKGSVAPIHNGLKIHYRLIPSATLAMQQLSVMVDLSNGDWTGGNFRVGNQPVTLSASYLQQPVFPGMPSITTGPSAGLGGVSFELEGKDPMGVGVEDERQWGEQILEWILNFDKTQSEGFLWKAGDPKELDFTLYFDRPVNLTPQIQEGRQFRAIKAEMATGYPVAKDSEVVEAFLAHMTYTGHPEEGQSLFLVPADFKLQRLAKSPGRKESYRGMMAWDTGTAMAGTEKNDPIFITTEFLEKMGFPQLNNGRNRIVSPFQGEQYGTLISSDSDSSVGPVKIEMEVGDAVFDGIRLLAAKMEDALAPLIARNCLDGVFPRHLMENTLFSMDFKNQKIYLRPLDSERRTFFEGKPLAEVSEMYQESGLIYIPVTINEKVKGYALFDTGNFATRVDTKKVNLSGKPISSYKIGEYEVMNTNPGFKPIIDEWQMDKDFLKEDDIRKNMISWVGNDALKNLFITVDPKENKIYIEKNE